MHPSMAVAMKLPWPVDPSQQVIQIHPWGILRMVPRSDGSQMGWFGWMDGWNQDILLHTTILLHHDAKLSIRTGCIRIYPDTMDVSGCIQPHPCIRIHRMDVSQCIPTPSPTNHPSHGRCIQMHQRTDSSVSMGYIGMNPDAKPSDASRYIEVPTRSSVLDGFG